MARKKASEGAVSRVRDVLTTSRGRWLLRIGGGALLLLVVGFVVQATRAQAWSMPAYRLTPKTLRVEGLPSWLDGYGKALFDPRWFARATGPFSVSIYDPQAEAVITERVERHPLVERASLVTLRYPNEAHVRVQLREPVASISFAVADGKTVSYLLGADQTLLPLDPYRGLLQRRRHPLPQLSGIGLRPPVRRTATGWDIVIGSPWRDGEDDRVEEAVAAAQTAARLEQDLGGLVTVQAIDVARFTRTGRLRSDEQHAEVELTVIGPPQRPGGPRVRRVVLWGRTTRAAHEVVGESGYGRKVERLKKLLSQPNAPARLEVRWDA